MKKIILILFVAILCCLFFSCAELISEKKVEVDAIITEVDRDPMIVIGNVRRPADYDIYFEYDGIEGSWDVNKATYNEYKDKVGEIIKRYLITSVYDNGEVIVKLVAVEDYI